MEDKELYRHLLGLTPPWSISRVELSVKTQQVDVWVEHAEGLEWACPECGAKLGLYDHEEERAWRHLDSCQFLTYLHARPPRVNCPRHGVKQVKLPWAEPHSRFTQLFERLAIDVLKETSIRGATRILRISWDEAWHLMQRAVERGLRAKPRRVPERLGVDEKSISKWDRYMTLVCDLDTSTVEYVEDGRRKESLAPYFKRYSPEEREGISAIAMDMWAPYIESTLENVPGAADKIVFDLYHIMTYMNEAVDDVRKRENRDLREEGDESLKGSLHIWLYGKENLPERHRQRFEELKALNLKTGRAWAIKESLRELWKKSTTEEAREHWKPWYWWATHSRLKPVIDAARTIHRHLHNVLTYFVHRITNAVSEGINSKIQTIKKKAYGFRSFENFKTAIFFHCGGLKLYPATHGNP